MMVMVSPVPIPRGTVMLPRFGWHVAPVDGTEMTEEQLYDVQENDVVIRQSSNNRKHPGNDISNRLISQNVETCFDVFEKFDKTWKAEFFLGIVQTIHEEGGGS
jgi:hypothetical protein